MSESWIELAAKECAAEVLVGAGEQTFARIIKSRFKGPTPRPWLRAEEVTEEGSYWWVNEASYACPVTVYVLKSGTDGSCFASAGQLGFVKSRSLFDLGGLWQRIPEPELPKEESA